MLQNYSNQNLAGKSFDGQNLEGVDFNHARLGRVSFVNTILHNANFREAFAGIHWSIILPCGLVLLFLSFVGNFMIGISVTYFISPTTDLASSAWFVYLSIVCTFLAVSIFAIQNIQAMTMLWVMLGGWVVSLFFLPFSTVWDIDPAVFGIWTLTGILAWAGVWFMVRMVSETITGIFSRTIITTVILLGSMFGIINGSIFWASMWSLQNTATGIISGFLVMVVAGGMAIRLLGTVAVIVEVIFAGMLIVAVRASEFFETISIMTEEIISELLLSDLAIIALAWVVPATVIVSLLMLFSVYIAERIYQEDPQFAALRRAGLWLLALCGPRFKAADLSEADFSDARLAGVSFMGAANLDRVNWRNSQGLKAARLGGTILEEPAVRELLVMGKAEGLCFRGLRLEGAYLGQASLANADFTGADLRRADLRAADLIGANLAKADLRGADLSGAILTGACLADWLTDETTLLDGAKANFVFLGISEAGEYMKRQPLTGDFREGEFSVLFRAAPHTSDFFIKGRSELDSLLHVADELRGKITDNKLEVRRVEKKGDAIMVCFSGLSGIEREWLCAEFKRRCEIVRGLPKLGIDTKFIEEDEPIANLKEILQMETRC